MKSLCGRFGTSLGVLREIVSCGAVRRTYGRVKARRRPALSVKELGADASIRVVPPSFRSLVGSENPAFLYTIYCFIDAVPQMRSAV